MRDDDGCLKWVALACIIVALYVWVNNVDQIVIKEQLPPPQDSWEIVYPRFRDDVSSQLLNTQELIGIALEDTSYIKSQNSDIQYSLVLLLNELGIVKQTNEEESKKQRSEQWIATGASVVIGWLLAVLVPTQETLSKIRDVFSKRSKREIMEHQGFPRNAAKAKHAKVSLWELIQTDSVARVLAVIFLLSGIAFVILSFLGYVLN